MEVKALGYKMFLSLLMKGFYCPDSSAHCQLFKQVVSGVCVVLENTAGQHRLCPRMRDPSQSSVGPL